MCKIIEKLTYFVLENVLQNGKAYILHYTQDLIHINTHKSIFLNATNTKETLYLIL